MLPREGGIVFIPYYFLLLRDMVPKLLMKYVLLIIILRVYDPGIPSSRIPSQGPDSAPLHGESASGFSIDLGVVLYVTHGV